MKRPLENTILRFTLSAITVAAITFLCYRLLHVNYATVGFGFLLAVLLISANWGLSYATFTAILATVAYNYFFLPPLFRFTIADPQNWIALLTFLVTAVVASQLSERARRSALSATTAEAIASAQPNAADAAQLACSAVNANSGGPASDPLAPSCASTP